MASQEKKTYTFKAISPDDFEVHEFKIEAPDLNELENSEQIEPNKSVTMSAASKINISRQLIKKGIILIFPFIPGLILYIISHLLGAEHHTNLGLMICSVSILYIILFFWFKSHCEALAIRRCEEKRRKELYLRYCQINPNAAETIKAMNLWYQARAELQALEWYKQLPDNIDE